MTPNSFARINLFMWLSKTCRLAPTPENFARVMRVHYQPKSISVRGSDGVSMEMEPQYGCYTFAFQHTAPSPVGASKNKWPGDWSSFWFYHKVPLDPETKHHPLVVQKLGNLGDTPKVDVARIPANEAFMTVFREVSKVLSMRDIIEEFVACGCFPLREGCTISSWAPSEREVYGLPMPNFSEVFGLRQERKFFFARTIITFVFVFRNRCSGGGDPR
jgi:hypothetical protein